MRRLRVLICAFACHPDASTGGEDILGWNLVRQMARSHDVWVVTTAENREAILAHADSAVAQSLHVVAFDLPRFFRALQHLPGGIQAYTYAWQLGIYPLATRLHRTYAMDCFHHVTYANDWMASFIGAWLPVPYLRGPGGGAHRVPYAFLREFSLRGRIQEYLRTLAQHLFRLDPFFRAGQQRARALLVCNPEALQAIPHQWRHKASPFPVNGVSLEDLARLDAIPSRPASGTFRVLSAGKLIRLKGLPLAIRAFARFAQQHPNATFEIVGNGPDRSFLQRVAHDAGVGSRIQFTPWMPRAQFLEALRDCDVFLFPSLRDGGGAVVVEAMAAGQPVICFQLGGPALHVTEECGIRITANTVEQSEQDLCRALETLYQHPELRARMGTAARRRIDALYRWDRLGDQLAAIYRSIVEPARTVREEGLSGGDRSALSESMDVASVHP